LISPRINFNALLINLGARFNISDNPKESNVFIGKIVVPSINIPFIKLNTTYEMTNFIL
jgi:hypothetical protein